MLRIKGECTFPKAVGVTLRRPGSRIPQVRGPAIVERSGNPPGFDVAIDPARFYALEVCTDPSLFQQRDTAGWTPDQTYATWADGPLLTAAHVALPADAWNRLKHADCLFYRLRTSSKPNGWADVEVSPTTSDPSVYPLAAIVDSLQGLTDPDCRVVFRVVLPASPAPVTPATAVTLATVAAVAYSEPVVEPLRHVTILPDGVTLDIDDVF